jgi:DNA-binding GntR family transcriptional regulator
MSRDVMPVRPVPVWRPVRGGNAFEITVARLAQAIKLGLVREGERLPPERELAERLQVSRVTLHEAIRALREAGYLESRRGRTGGTFVLPNARLLAAIPVLRRNLDHSDAQHTRIVEAIVAGDTPPRPGGNGGTLRRDGRTPAGPVVLMIN